MNQLAYVVCCAVMLPLSVAAAFAAPRYHSPYDVAYCPKGDALAVSDRTAGQLTLIDPIEGKVVRHVDLRGEPTGVAWSADGKLVFAAEYNASSVAVVDLIEGKVLRRLKVGPRPIGIAIAPNTDLLLVANNATGTVSVIDLKTGQQKARIGVSREPFAIAVTPDESLAVVSNLLPRGKAIDQGHAAVVSLIDLKTLTLLTDIRLPAGSSSVRDVAVSADGKWAYLVHTLGRTNLPTTQVERGWINTNGLSILDLERRELYATILLDHPQEGAADPWGLAVANDGSRLFVSISGGHQLARIDLATLHTLLAGKIPDDHRLAKRKHDASGTESIWLRIKHDPSQRARLVNDLSALHSAGLIFKTRVDGKGPRGIALSPDGKTLASALYYSGVVVLTDVTDGKTIRTVPLGVLQPEGLARQGESIFHDATRCFQQWMSCATCHPNNGRVDGMNWDLLNDGIGNPKNNKSLLQAYRTPPMMWRGIRDDLMSAVEKGFSFQMRQPEPSDVKAVLAYLESLKPESSPYLEPGGKRSAAAERGQAIFASKATKCFHCHSGSLLTDQKLHDVGTRGELDKSAVFETPSLIEIYRTGPYLHDGSAATLREVLVERNSTDAHGKTSHLSGEQIEELVEYLKSL